MNIQKITITKPIIAINDLCKMLQLSRSRYYQLVDSGFFPKPLRDPRSDRPYYNIELQKQILEAKESGIGVNGSFMLFYAPRRKDIQIKTTIKSKKADSVIREFTETLQSMGLDCTEKDVTAGMTERYPNGIEGMEKGLVIRELFRFLKQK